MESAKTAFILVKKKTCPLNQVERFHTDVLTSKILNIRATNSVIMRRANADSSHNVTVSMVHDFFNLSAPRPQTEACPKIKGRQVDEFDGGNRENEIHFKLMKTEDSEG